jgi:hypothetical protein
MSAVGRAYLTIEESADIARCHPVTIRRAILARRLAVSKPNGKHGRSLIRTADLMSWLDGSRIAAVGELRKKKTDERDFSPVARSFED